MSTTIDPTIHRATRAGMRLPGFDGDATSAEPAGERRRLSASDEARGTVLKYKADRGPVAYVIGMFVVHLLLWWFATPLVALASTIPLAIASMFVAPINHHHQHLNTFRSAVANRFYDLALALQTGVAPYSWTLHHNLGHHLNYLNQHPHERPDESAWTRRDGTQMGRVEYTIDMLLRHQSDIFRVGQQYPRYRAYWLAMKLPLYGLIGAALWINPLNTLLIFLIPGFMALTHTIWATYEHHAGCPTDDHVLGSFNRENALYNWMTGNLGLHAAHHSRPGLHWSLLPLVHEEIRDRIPESQIATGFW